MKTAQRKPRPPKITETSEHLTIASYFRKIGLGGTAIATHIRGERSGHYQRIMAARMGALAKLPDWLIIDGGQAGFIELKPRGWKARVTRTGTYTPHEWAQLEMHQRLRVAGAWVAIVESLEEMLDVLAYRGVPLREESLTAERIRRGFTAAQAALRARGVPL